MTQAGRNRVKPRLLVRWKFCLSANISANRNTALQFNNRQAVMSLVEMFAKGQLYPVNSFGFRNKHSPVNLKKKLLSEIMFYLFFLGLYNSDFKLPP